MADDLKIRGPQDPKFVNVNEQWEVTYWSEKFGCTAGELRKAVNAVGTSVTDVQAYLKRPKPAK